MNHLIAASAGMLLALSGAAMAGSAAPHLAQADTGADSSATQTGPGTGSPVPAIGEPGQGSDVGSTPPATTFPGKAGATASRPGATAPRPSGFGEAAPSAAPATPLPTIGTTASAPAPQASPPKPNLAPPQFSGTQRNNPVSTPSALTPGTGALPYGGTQATLGVPRAVPTQPYGGTQRDSVGSVSSDLQAHGGVPTYTGTQATLGGPQNLGSAGQPGDAANTQSYGAQPYGGQPYGTPQIGGTQRNSTAGLPPGASSTYTGSAIGNGTIYSRQPLGARPYTRDQIGVYGGIGSYDARGVYTGVAPQPNAFGQPYANYSGPVGGTVRSTINGTAAIRPYIPPINSPGPTNSGYGIPNGSKPSYMDARGIQRSN